MRIVKNEKVIAAKREKLIEEIEYLVKNDGPALVLNAGYMNRKDALRMKRWQMQIQDFTERATVEQLALVLYKVMEMLCKACKEDGLPKGDPRCSADLRKFIYCDMIRQSLVKEN